MKRIIILAFALVVACTVCAQQDVTTFLGIPVDGTKTEMRKKLIEKGFTPSKSDSDALVGEFNGEEVFLYIQTNNNKVYRIIVADARPRDEIQIRNRYNQLLYQFKNNKRYTVPLFGSANEISEDEKILHEILINKKSYEADFIQNNSYQNFVWFCIRQSGFEQYVIAIYYENQRNAANGEDL